MKVKNTTIQNRSKQARLNSSHTMPMHAIENVDVSKFLQGLQVLPYSKEHILFSIGRHLVGVSNNPAVKRFLAEYDYPELKIEKIPSHEFDLLGLAYQYLNTKLENLEKGSFYTGGEIAYDFVSDLDFSSGQTILDPSCGSGSFLFRSAAGAEQIFGVDVDPIAVMIAKFNYFIKFPQASDPKIYHVDFFEWLKSNGKNKFDYVIGNPPYGANMDLSVIPTNCVTSGESFSYFIEFGFKVMRDGGIFRYLLPESVLNVKRHTDIRQFILNNANLTRIKQYSKKFTGVMSDVYMIELKHGRSKTVVFESNGSTKIPKKLFAQLKNQIFVNLSERDVRILEIVEAKCSLDLSQSIFGLGVVTGDNKSKLFSSPQPGAEPIYTGKQVVKYGLLSPNQYLHFNRDELQQVAPDEIYRAPEKLVYKTISKHLKFAVDRSQSLTSNSANIVLPVMPGYSIDSVMALLNSSLYSFLHLKLFGGVNKIAKENLMALPFPSLSLQERESVDLLLSQAILDQDDSALQSFIHQEIFGLSQADVAYIESAL